MSEEQPNSYRPQKKELPISAPLNPREDFRNTEEQASLNLAKGEFHLPLTSTERQILLEDHPEAKEDLEKINTGKMTWNDLRSKWGW